MVKSGFSSLNFFAYWFTSICAERHSWSVIVIPDSPNSIALSIRACGLLIQSNRRKFEYIV